MVNAKDGSMCGGRCSNEVSGPFWRLVDHFGIGIGKTSGGGAVNSFVLLDMRWLWINGPRVTSKWFGIF